MRQYHNFWTDLPDEFVEAHAEEIRIFSSSGSPVSKPYWLTRSNVILGMNDIGLGNISIGPRDAKELGKVHDWMVKNKGVYSGGYWKSYQANQRGSGRAAGQAGGGHTTATVDPGTGQITSIAVNNPSPSLTASQINMLQQQLIHQKASKLMGLAPPIFMHPSAADWGVQPARPELKREMKLGEIVGYRCWRVIEKGPQSFALRSVYQPDVWQPDGILEGRGLEDWGQRGVHAWKEVNSPKFLEYINEYLVRIENVVWNPPNVSSTRVRSTNTALVTGSILLWGDVVEHDHGYRGEFAKVKSIDWLYPSQAMMGRERDILDALRRHYGV